jgi:hypothetical protein
MLPPRSMAQGIRRWGRGSLRLQPPVCKTLVWNARGRCSHASRQAGHHSAFELDKCGVPVGRLHMAELAQPWVGLLWCQRVGFCDAVLAPGCTGVCQEAVLQCKVVTHASCCVPVGCLALHMQLLVLAVPAVAATGFAHLCVVVRRAGYSYSVRAQVHQVCF